MTFEEFFNKKRINLELMAEADPILYAEFKSHFNLMGEKSFDHSKKFWFNKLRHLYQLVLVPKEKPVVVEPNLATQAEPLQSPTIEVSQPIGTIPQPTGKPGFKPRHIKVAPLISDEVKDLDGRPGTANESEDSAEAERPTEVEVKETPKPAYKPRFSAKVVAKPPIEEIVLLANLPIDEKPAEKEQDETPKPAYKPRFSAGNMKPKKED